MKFQKERIGLLLFCLALGLSAFFYQGPGHEIWRGNGGDVVAVLFLGLLFGAFCKSQFLGPIIALAIAIGLEVAQTNLQTNGTPRDLIVGAVFDWWDIAAYAIGAVLAMLAEWDIRRRRSGFLSG